MTPEQINDFFSLLHTGRIGQIVFWLQLIAGILTSALLAAIAVISIKFRQLMSGAPKPQAVPAAEMPSREFVSGPWQEALSRLSSTNPADWNLAVIRADSVFDGVLKDMGLAGQTLGERLLKLDFSKLASLNEVWEAHKIRNRIVHETDRVLTHEEARYAVSLFEKALRELQYLQE